MSKKLQEQQKTSHLSGNNANYIEEMLEDYLTNPDSVPEHWQNYFRNQDTQTNMSNLLHRDIKAAFYRPKTNKQSSPGGINHEAARKQAGVLRLINAYRVRGHQQANLDPLQLVQRPPVPDLEMAFHHLDESDLNTTFNTGSLAGPDELSLQEILKTVQQVYCQTVGLEYMHITDTQQRIWLQQRFESAKGQFNLPPDERIEILKKLTAAEGLERYLHTKYVGQKRFSLEGADSLIPALHSLIQHTGKNGVKEIVIGMAHRGRLNVLINILGKSSEVLFNEFEGKSIDTETLKSGDVKYHLGFSSDVMAGDNPVHLALAFNPSHLEIIDPVVVGSVKARQIRRDDANCDLVMPLLIHGDAAFAGQGVVMETFNMSQARGFHTGGTFHIIVNNQIGFTTSNPLDARSTFYCTEVAKLVQAPIFHVNGDDPEAVLFAVKAAADFRKEFKKDVVIDLICYRQHGHNEADEPAATQPVMYQAIRSRKTVRHYYAEKLISENIITEPSAQEFMDEYRELLDQGKAVIETVKFREQCESQADWQPYLDNDNAKPVKTAISKKACQQYSQAILTIPDDFKLHSRAKRIMEDRDKMANGKLPMDWGFAETMAYASLLKDGFQIRITGQDSGRGTFFHRHAVLHHQDDDSKYTPLEHISANHDDFTIIDSLLSEEAVLAFEYGYSTAEPKTLVIWEAQFGDFANGAQVVIDQFISSGEAKWGRLCGLVMFLPHGYEGQGPEHSSARLERFMQLCAHNNMQVCIPTTPAQMFHMIRRQMLQPLRKPLIVMTPKSLLRHKSSVSPIADLTTGNFHKVIPETENIDAKNVNRVVMCSGKVYYDLLAARENEKINHIAIIRIEQVYPFPREEVIKQLSKYNKAKDIVWCQEEPMNQGIWYQTKHHFQHCLQQGQTLSFAGRPSSSSPAVGYLAIHNKEQTKLINKALAIHL